MNLLFVLEHKATEEKNLISYLKKQGYSVDIIDDNPQNRVLKLKKWHKIVELIQYIKLALRANKKVQSNDIVICSCFTTGLFCSYLMRQKKIKVIALNILIQNKEGIGGKMRNSLYKHAFDNDFFWGTGNSLDAVALASKILGKNLYDRFFILHDPIHFLEKKKNNQGVSGAYCFSGGTSGRDWSTLNKVINLTPTVNYKIIAGSGNWNNEISKQRNVSILFDQPRETFDKLLDESCLVVLPVISEMTSGLLVILQAISTKKLVITTDTAAIREYFPPAARALLCEIGDFSSMAKKVNYFVSHPNECEYYSNLLYSFNKDKMKKHNYEEEFLHIVKSVSRIKTL